MNTKTTRQAQKGHLSSGRSSSLIRNKFQTLWPKRPCSPQGLLMFLWPQGRNRLVPRSHIVQTHCFLFVTTKIMALWENYLRPAKTSFTKPRWIPEWTKRNKLGHQQVVHIPHSLQAATKKTCVLDLCQLPLSISTFGSIKCPFQISISCQWLQETCHWFSTGQASQPQFTKAY